MSDTDVIVPIEIHSLLVTRAVNLFDEFRRWSPQYGMMLDSRYKNSAEPTVHHSEGSPGEGIHVQWQLPEALTAGRIDSQTGESHFPLVPNRWLVIRYADMRGTRKAAGFLVHSDYLEKADGPGGPMAFTPFLDPTAPRDAPKLDYIGRVHPLTDGPWTEPTRREPFLTAIGNGLPAFAAFASYHENVFCFHDTLEDLKENDNYPPPATVSYCVIGWYSEDDADILTRARQIPGLLPPDADPNDPANVASALGWLLPADTPSGDLVRTRYAGTSIGIPWDREGGHPVSDRDGRDVKVAVGHSTADAATALVNRQSSRRDGDLLRALFHGDPEDLDDPDGRVTLDEITRRSWFSGHDGGYTWHVVNRPHDGVDPQAPPPEQPAWLEQLNADQAAYDAELPRLTNDQWRLWSLWWMSNLPERRRPRNFEFDKAEWDAEIRVVTAAVEAGQATITTLRDRIPHGTTPEAFERAVEEHATREGLPAELELKRSVRQTFYRPADPVIAVSGLGNGQPLTRDEDDPLPCRVPSRLLSEVRINGAPLTPSDTPLLPPSMTGLPEVCTALVAEFALFHQAFRTPASGSGSGPTALHTIVADPGSNSTGPWPEYTRVWRQPWLPLYIQWEAKYCATPYANEQGVPYWDFDDNERRYQWSGNGAARGDGEGGMRWTAFGNRAFITPSTQYVLREQARRQAQYAPPEVANRLNTLRSELVELDILSQTLDGFNDWLVQFDGMAQATTDPEILDAAGETNHVPDGAEDRRMRRFQPVRAGQFYFIELTVIDRFGRELRLVRPDQTQPIQFPLIRADSVTPDAYLFGNPPPGQQRFVQMPPRLLSPARVRLDAVRHSGEGVLSSTALPADTPVAGWLLVNDLDATLLVYAPDGSPLGELRVVHDSSNTEIIAWNPLPHAPLRHPRDTAFRDAYPDIAGFALGMIGLGPEAPGPGPNALGALMESIDEAFDHIDDPAPTEDRSIARLIGRPVALVRADLGIDLQGRPLTDSDWEKILHPPEDAYPDYGWTVKLGDPDRLSDGLIGYFAGNAPDESIRYDTLRAVWPSTRSPYVAPIGGELVLPARPDDRPVTHHLTLLFCPHTAVHATTDILPVTELRLDADTTHQAMARIRASFRLNPLLAPDYIETVEEQQEARDGAPVPEAGVVMPRPAAWHGDWTWAEPFTIEDSDQPGWDELVIRLADDLSHPDAPVPAARAGYLQLLPRGRSQSSDDGAAEEGAAR